MNERFELKRLVLIIFLIVIGFSTCFAQKLSVERFVEKTNDLSASTNVRTDNNGVACALVKVQLVADGAQFEPNVVGSVERKVNEYWVYLPAGSNRLNVKHPNYPATDVVFSDYGISSLDSKCTYELVLTIPESTPTSNYGSINVETSPDDAKITLDGKDMGVTPLFLQNVPIGTHKIIISKDKCLSVEQTVTVRESETAEINANLYPQVIHNLINNMVRVEGGTFMMGATSEQGSDAFDVEKPVHKVTVSSFSIGKYEVTQEEWQAVMGNNPSEFKGAKRPVESVYWGDCQEFIRKLNAMTGMNFRLPTEAEWEFAARGGIKSRHTKYSGSSSIGAVAWYDGNCDDQTHNVGQKSPNELGLYDMTGNVFEWCQDKIGDYSSSSQTNPRGPSLGYYHVLRGGCFDLSPIQCRVSYRHACAPGYVDYEFGLRLAM